jgi:hypothetical protein
LQKSSSPVNSSWWCSSKLEEWPSPSAFGGYTVRPLKTGIAGFVRSSAMKPLSRGSVGRSPTARPGEAFGEEEARAPAGTSGGGASRLSAWAIRVSPDFAAPPDHEAHHGDLDSGVRAKRYEQPSAHTGGEPAAE